MPSDQTKPAEYSYFRADGLSLAAIETVTEAKTELAGYRKKICAKFGADDLMYGKSAAGQFEVSTLVFRTEEKIPAGWTVDRQMSNDGATLVAAFGLPPEGTKEHFHLVNMAGLMERAIKLSRLEGVFGCGEMPMKELPAGQYIGSFVLRETLHEGTAAITAGQIRDNATFCFGSNSACRASDPLDFMKLDGAWYIRVPNKAATEQPVFTPPDADPVPYGRMRTADRAEWNTRHGIQKNNFPSIH